MNETNISTNGVASTEHWLVALMALLEGEVLKSTTDPWVLSSSIVVTGAVLITYILSRGKIKAAQAAQPATTNEGSAKA